MTRDFPDPVEAYMELAKLPDLEFYRKVDPLISALESEVFRIGHNLKDESGYAAIHEYNRARSALRSASKRKAALTKQLEELIADEEEGISATLLQREGDPPTFNPADETIKKRYREIMTDVPTEKLREIHFAYQTYLMGQTPNTNQTSASLMTLSNLLLNYREKIKTFKTEVEKYATAFRQEENERKEKGRPVDFEKINTAAEYFFKLGKHLEIAENMEGFVYMLYSGLQQRTP